MMNRVVLGTCLLAVGCMSDDVVVNHPPTMEALRFYGNEDVGVDFSLVAFDEDRDNLELAHFGAYAGNLSIRYVAHQLLSDATRLKISGVFEPRPNYNGESTLSIEVSDGKDSINVTHALVVIAVNDRPTAMHDAVAANANSPALIFPSTLLANDSDRDQFDRDYVPSLVVESVAKAMNGTATLEAGVITFTPDSNFTGIASFEYTLSDGYLTDTTSVGVAVGLPNAAPIAVDDALDIAPSISTVFLFNPQDLTRNDIDDDGHNLALVAVANAIHGTVEVNAGVVTFTLGPDFDGTAGFDYTVSDGVATDTAHATLFVPEPI